MSATSSTQPGESHSLNREIARKWTAKPNWVQSLRNALIITEREVRDSFRDWRIVIPIFMLTLVFPFLANFASDMFTGLLERYGEADTRGTVEAFLPLMPMLMGFFPISISLVIALETFVGEKERLSLEPLLSTPLTNTELYLGKMLAAIIPPLAAGYTGILLYVSFQIFGPQQWRPEPVLILQVFLLTTAQAIVMVTGAVVISSQTTSTRAANLLASFVIIPMSLLVIVESIIMISPRSRYVLWYIMVGLIVVVILLMRTGTRIFNREELLGRAIDHINLRWAWRTFWEQWNGGVKVFSPVRWYRESVFPAVRSLRPQLIVFLVCALGFFVAGWIGSYKYELPLNAEQGYDENVMDNLRGIFEMGEIDPGFAIFALTQNLRVLTLATFLATFTFGVLALFFTALPFGILGWVMGNIVQAGMSPLPFIAAIIPHGIAEIPAIAIAAAAALRMGAIITKPPQTMTVGEAWLRALADTIKIGIAVVLPLLILAAILEVQLTPRVVEWVLTH